MTNAASVHRIAITPHDGRVVVKFNGAVVADTTHALKLAEGSMSPVFYVPRDDATMSMLSPTTRTSHCPFKGDASYFSIEADGKTAESAVWSYRKPLPSVAAIKDHLAFYTDRVTIEA